jgi:hypothetical protein
MKRLLILARDYNTAQHWAKQQRLSQGYWVYVSAFYNIQGNAECPYVLLDNWMLRPDWEILKENLGIHKCYPDTRFLPETEELREELEPSSTEEALEESDDNSQTPQRPAPSQNSDLV